MAKKKNSQFLPGLLEDIMSLLTPEEQEIAFELFNDGANQVDEELSHIYYHHQCPDYRLIAQPIASYLMPLWTMDDMSSLSPAEIYSSCAVIPQETLERDLRNFIFNIFVVYRKMPEKCYSYRMWYALGIMEHFRMEHCLDIVLEVLRQDLDFYDFYFGYLYETMLSAITYQLGQNQLDVLMDFMKEPGLRHDIFLKRSQCCLVSDDSVPDTENVSSSNWREFDGGIIAHAGGAGGFG